jgi:MscS family membrane protein
MLDSHAAVEPETARIRFAGFGAYSLDLEVFAYVRTSDFGEFLAVSEDLNLRIMDIVEEAGTAFAFPSTTTYLESSSGLPAQRARSVSEEVAHLRERNELPLPRLPNEEIEALRGRIPWPAADGGTRR